MKSYSWRRRAGSVAVLAGLLAGGCGLDEVSIPELDGPSETGISVRMEAVPDLITADGFSTSIVTATLRGPDGRALGNRDLFFTITDSEGRFADIGSFPNGNGPGTGMTVRTNGNGVAQVVYQAPPRTDATANQIVLIAVRPMGNDAAGATYRTVKIELRSAEPRLFPQDPTNLPPDCNFVVEAPQGYRRNVTILFQTSAFDEDGTIVRYEWFFGDGTQPQYFPDVARAYNNAGSYTVTHRVTDDDGMQAACATLVTIQ